MIAKNNDILTSATESLFKLNADDLVRERCRAREEAERHERTVQRKITEQAETIKAQDETIKELKAIVTSLQKQLADKTD